MSKFRDHPFFEAGGGGGGSKFPGLGVPQRKNMKHVKIAVKLSELAGYVQEQVRKKY